MDLFAQKKIYSLGNSTVGFLAVILTVFIKIELCISFVPQFIVNSEIIPEENRWAEYVDNIKN